MKNVDFHKNLLKFAEITGVFMFTLNNKKYPQISVGKDTHYNDFLHDFYQHLDLNDNFALSLLPTNIVKNIFQIAQFIR